MSEENSHDILLSSEAAALCTTLGRPLTPASIRFAARSGALPCRTTATGVRLFNRDDVARYATKHRPFPRRSKFAVK